MKKLVSMTVLAALSTGAFAQQFYVNVMDQDLLAGSGNYRSVNNLFSIDKKDLLATGVLNCAFINNKSDKVIYEFDLAYQEEGFMLNSTLYQGRLEIQAETYGKDLGNMSLKVGLKKSETRSEAVVIGNKYFIQGNLPDDGQSWGEKLDFRKAIKLKIGVNDFKLKYFGKIVDASIECYNR